MRTRSVHRLPSALVLVLASLACAAGGGSPRSLVAGGARDGADRVAVAPVNLSVGHAPELVVAEEIVHEALIDYLLGRRLTVGIVHRGDAERAWQEAVRTSEGETDSPEWLEGAASSFARTLRSQSDFAFDYVLLPSVVYRKARVHGRIASWDGVRRRVTTRRARGASQEHYFEDWEGKFTGLSLHVSVYEPDGRQVYEGWGGLDLTHDPLVVGASMAAHPIPQAEILGDPDHVREGVERALRPYVGPGWR